LGVEIFLSSVSEREYRTLTSLESLVVIEFPIRFSRSTDHRGSPGASAGRSAARSIRQNPTVRTQRTATVWRFNPKRITRSTSN